jgi:hypothetical protein
LTFGLVWIRIGILLFPFLFGLGALSILRRTRSAWAIIVYPVIYLMAFGYANPLIFRWYLAPPLPVYFLLIFTGADRISKDIGGRIPSILLGLGALALTLNGWTLRPDHGSERPAPEMAWIRLELLYEGVGRDLQPSLRPGDVLAAGDIGAIGYYSRATILDTVGLVSPIGDQYYPLPDDLFVTNYAVSPDLILDQMPEYIVILEVYGRKSLLPDPRFQTAYQLQAKVETDIYNSDGMLIFRRVEGR